jgi:hypothetical protein
MKTRALLYSLVGIILFKAILIADQSSAPFSAGEKIRYAVYAAGFYMGTQTIEIESVEEYGGTEVFKIIGHTKSSPFVGIFFRIDDKWTVYTDRETILPVRMEKDLVEGKKRGFFVYDINQEEKTVLIQNKTKNKNKNVTADNLILDMFSLIYYYRKYPQRFKDPFTFDFLEERSVETVQARIEGDEEISVPKVTKTQNLPSVKLKQIGGIGIEIYVSVDDLRLPLKLVLPSKLSKKRTLLVEFYLEKYTPGVDQAEIPRLYKKLRF